jgi:hypothetical protein
MFQYTWQYCMCCNPANGRMEFEDDWLIKKMDMKLVSWPGPKSNLIIPLFTVMPPVNVIALNHTAYLHIFKDFLVRQNIFQCFMVHQLKKFGKHCSSASQINPLLIAVLLKCKVKPAHTTTQNIKCDHINYLKTKKNNNRYKIIVSKPLLVALTIKWTFKLL